MTNEIGKKLTSLTLMTIMVAGGVTFGIPGVIPAADAQTGRNANLFVSAEDSTFGNAMTGQVVEVVIRDNQIDSLDDAVGEPDVFVNNDDLRMVQANDGNWYGYFASRSMAQAVEAFNAENNVPSGLGIDFGVICLVASTSTSVDISVANAEINLNEADAVALPLAQGQDCPTDSDDTPTVDGTGFNVVREPKVINTNTAIQQTPGQIGINANYWPFVQLYDIEEDNRVEIRYEKGGGAQTVRLTYEDADDYDTITSDRATGNAPTQAIYPRSAEVHVTITDTSLDIDPTDVDTWTWSTVPDAEQVYYRVFDDNGRFIQSGETTGTTLNTANPDLSDMLGALLCAVCIVSINADPQNTGNPVLTLDGNNDNQIVYQPLTSSTDNRTLIQRAMVEGGVDSDEAEPMLGAGTQPFTVVETGPQTGIFVSYDEQDDSSVDTTSDAARSVTSTITYDDELTITFQAATATIDIDAGDGEWNSGTDIPVTLVDRDMNRNGLDDEDLRVSNPDHVIPTLVTGEPFTLRNGVGSNNTLEYLLEIQTNTISGDLTVETFSERAVIDPPSAINVTGTPNGNLFVDLGTTAAALQESINNSADDAADFRGFNYLNLDMTSFGADGDVTVHLWSTTDDNGILQNESETSTNKVLVSASSRTSVQLGTVDKGGQGKILLTSDVISSIFAIDGPRNIGLQFVLPEIDSVTDANLPFVADFFSYGFTDDGNSSGERVANQIIRIELEETGDNTSTFEGTLEYYMVNQLSILDQSTYDGVVSLADDEVSFVAIEDLTDEDAPRVNYLDLGSDGVETQISDQEAAPTHSGSIEFDAETYKVADTVMITLTDVDLNTDSALVDVFTVVTSPADDDARDAVGSAGLAATNKGGAAFSFGPLGRLADVTFNDEIWTSGNSATCRAEQNIRDTGLGATGFTLRETGVATGIFVGNFQIPPTYCPAGSDAPASVTGTDIEVNYVDFRDVSGEIIEVGASAGVRANTGSVSLDRTVYPVPWAAYQDGAGYSGGTPGTASVFPVHATVVGSSIDSASKTLGDGAVVIHARVNDPDFDVSASGEDRIAQNTAAGVGPLKVTVSRGADRVTLGYAGGPDASDGRLDVGDDGIPTMQGGADDNRDTAINESLRAVRQLGPITEIAGDAGIFELDLAINFNDGPASRTCPTNDNPNMEGEGDSPERSLLGPSENYCILQGDILTVEYTDPTDASGDPNTVTDSATFDLRNGVLQSDKNVYIIGSDMILTIIEPDWNLDNDGAETYSLNAVEWDSTSGTLGLAQELGGVTFFDPEPSDFRETGDDTGIFQVVLEVPEAIAGDRLERGEEIELEYTDWGPSGANYVGEEDEDVNLTVYTSNFGATVELDQKVYTWTDKVFITIVAPDHNFDSQLIDEIGETSSDSIRVATRTDDIDRYKLVETGTDTGIFTGEVILTGFLYDADGDDSGDNNGNDTNPRTSPDGSGPTDGYLRAEEDTGLSVSFEFSEDETVVGSALVRWNVGVTQWLEASYPASGTGVVRIVDPDMNLNPESVDNFDVDVWSESDSGGIDLTVTETNEATGIFEGTVFFTTTDESSGHRLRVSEGDTVTARYFDYTLPAPDDRGDRESIQSTSLIGTIVPPLERAPISNLRVVNSFGNTLDTVNVDQQVQITATLTSGQDEDQAFAYLVQIQDANGVTVALAWIQGTLGPAQTFDPALSWTPAAAGSYTATAFAWESIDNPTALSPPAEFNVTVS